MNPGQEASGKLVTVVRNQAKQLARDNDSGYILIDGSPGIGCPVIASIGGVDLVLVVTEPTVSGIHDLERILAVTRHFNVPASVCINKADINQGKAGEIRDYCADEDVKVAGEIPYDLSFTRAQIKGTTVMESGSDNLKKMMRDLWNEVYDSLRQ